MSYTSHGIGAALLTTGIVCLVLTWVFFIIRIYTRAVLTKVWKIEDWLFVVSQISFTLHCVISLMSTIHGNGQLNKDINPKDIPIAMEWFYWGEIAYLVTALAMRLSIGFFILRIMTQQSFKWIIHITMWMITLASIMHLFYTIFQCAPIRYFWLQFSGLPGKCLPALQVQNVAIAYSACAAAADLVFGILPIFVLWNLQMNRKAKMIVGGLLCVGIVAGLSVIVRIKYIHDVSLTQDFMYATANVSIWALVEPAIAICCMAASTWRPLFKSLRDKTLTPSGYGATAPMSANRYFNGSAARGARQSGLGLGSRNHTGYLQTMDDKETGSFDDSIALRSLASPGTRGSDGDDDTKGILTSTTVEITRQNRQGDRNV